MGCDEMEAEKSRRENKTRNAVQSQEVSVSAFSMLPILPCEHDA